MADTPSIGLMATTGGTMTAATMAPTVNWALHGFPMATMPESTPLLIAAGAIIGAHALQKVASTWWAKRTAAATAMKGP